MKLYKGDILSKRIGMGRVLFVSRAPFASSDRAVSTLSEKERFEHALLLASEKLKTLAGSMPEGGEAGQILESERLILSDEGFVTGIRNLIAEGRKASEAIREVTLKYEAKFMGTRDKRISTKALDMDDIAGILTACLNDEAGEILTPGEPFIIATDELTPSTLAEYLSDDLKGIVVSEGSFLSHTAVIARAHEIPMISVRGCEFKDCDGLEAIVDANEGHFFTEPDYDLSAFYRRRVSKDPVPVKKIPENVSIGTRTFANIAGVADAIRAKDRGAEGIGLFRTEFLYMGRPEPPTEAESLEIYSKVLELFSESPVIVRTFDLGGDKQAEYLKDREELKGLRGIKLAIRENELLFTQIRALMRANIYGNLKVMLPMVYGKTDILNVKAVIRAAKKSLEEEGLLYRDFPLGIMMETRSAVNAAEELSEMSKFFSIGTNDLRADFAGVDRLDAGEEVVSDLEPVREAVKRVIDIAKEAEIPVGICGETEGLESLIPGLDYVSK